MIRNTCLDKLSTIPYHFPRWNCPGRNCLSEVPRPLPDTKFRAGTPPVSSVWLSIAYNATHLPGLGLIKNHQFGSLTHLE
jgi:hypothetical protein